MRRVLAVHGIVLVSRFVPTTSSLGCTCTAMTVQLAESVLSISTR